MPLTAAAVTELTSESAPKALFHEWLTRYFDGGLHDVGQTTVVPFPKAAIKFDVSDIDQPLQLNDADNERAEIRCICLPVREHDRTVKTDVKLSLNHVVFQFWIRAAARDVASARALGQEVAEKLVAILRNASARFDLTSKGVGHCRPRKPQLVPDPHYTIYVVSCRAEVYFEIRF